MFQFPSNGKDILNGVAVAKRAKADEFQFPSNGKDILNARQENVINPNLVFQFPSNGKDILNLAKDSDWRVRLAVGFNSLQTGKTF